MKAEVLKSCTVNDVPKKAGDTVEVDDNVFRNMSKKGLLKAAGASHRPAHTVADDHPKGSNQKAKAAAADDKKG